ncbi:MAG TPA: alpha/beta hydrolase [Mucilaginibacter sp.]|jgi:acetyl esterase/lipase|nr:alpha/beta hydrolase [Mucilaginibacter sp.]
MNKVTENHEAIAEVSKTGFAFDPEVGAAIAALVAKSPSPQIPERGDWKSVRETGNAGWRLWANAAPDYPDVRKKSFFTNTQDGASIELRWYTKEGSKPGSAVVYAHGGGMILGSLDVYDFVVSEYVSKTGVPFLAVDYRLAPESKGTMLAEDVFSGITWLVDHALELDIDTTRIAVMGDSGGGAPAAGATILARERKVLLAYQVLIYPMLDDRNIEPDPFIKPFSTWTYDNNYTAWNAVLGNEFGKETVSSIVAPARLTDFAGLPPAYIETGELDIFRDEDIAYAQHLLKAGVPVELHVHSGAPHGYDRIAPGSKLTRRAMNDRVRIIQSL